MKHSSWLLEHIFSHPPTDTALVCWQGQADEENRRITYQWLQQACLKVADWLQRKKRCTNGPLGLWCGGGGGGGATSVNTIVVLLAAHQLGWPVLFLGGSVELNLKLCRKTQCHVVLYDTMDSNTHGWNDHDHDNDHDNDNDHDEETHVLGLVPYRIQDILTSDQPHGLEEKRGVLSDEERVQVPVQHETKTSPSTGTDELQCGEVAVTVAVAVTVTVAGSSSTDILYYLPTSGSTGEPKIVKGLVRGLCNRVQWQLDTFPVDASNKRDQVSLAKTSLTFVDAMAEIWVPLVAGTPLVVVDTNTNTNSDNVNDCSQATVANPWRNPHAILLACQRHKVTRLVVTPTLLRSLLRSCPTGVLPPSLLYLHCSGEPLSNALVRATLTNNPKLILVNIYGSTEVGADVCCMAFDYNSIADDEQKQYNYATVGQPLSNCGIHLLLPQENAHDGGATIGEIVVTGWQVAQGYEQHAAPQGENTGFGWLTTMGGDGNSVWSKSTDQTSSTSTSTNTSTSTEWCFRTGDLGEWDKNGTLRILGRNDQVVKIRGQKVSLLQVETVLRDLFCDGIAILITRQDDGTNDLSHNTHHEVIVVAVVVRNASSGNSSICCGHSEAPLSTVVIPCRVCELKVRVQLREHLKETSRPHRIFCTSRLPVTQSGKVDRTVAKTAVIDILRQEREHSSMKTKRESVLHIAEKDPRSFDGWLAWFMGAFQDLLGRRADRNDSFFELGGTSITSIQLLSLLHNQIDGLGLQFSGPTSLLQLLEENATPWQLADLMSKLLSDPNHEGDKALNSASIPPPMARKSTLIEVTPLQAKDIPEVSALAAATFCAREPVVASLLKDQKRAKRFGAQIKQLCQQLLAKQMCFVARRRPISNLLIAKSEAIIAFTLANSVVHKRPTGNSCLFVGDAGRRLLRVVLQCYYFQSQLPELKPADELYGELFHQWCAWRDILLTENDCVQIILSGAAQDCSFGAGAVGLCEAAAIRSARERGYRIAYTICTNATTKYIATNELGMRERVSLKTLAFLGKFGADTKRCRESGLSDEHEVSLFDLYLDDRARRLDSGDCHGAIFQTETTRMVPLRDSNTPMFLQIEELIKKSFRYFRTGDISREMRHLHRREGHALLLKDEHGNKLVGCAILYMHGVSGNAITETGVGGNVEIIFLAVQRDHRGRGASSRILAEIKSLRRRCDWDSLFLRTTSSLRRVYQKQGFTEAGPVLVKSFSAIVSADEDEIDLQSQIGLDDCKLMFMSG